MEEVSEEESSPYSIKLGYEINEFNEKKN